MVSLLKVCLRQMHQFVFFTGGVVFLTLIINGSTTQFLLRFLNMDKVTETKVITFLATDLFFIQPARFLLTFNSPSIDVAIWFASRRLRHMNLT
jgi:hypothetical protein